MTNPNLYEVRSSGMRHGKLHLVPADQLPGLTGFQSLYGFPLETATVIQKQGGTFGLEGLPLYSDILFIDFDNDDEAAFACRSSLAGYRFDFYNTGNRGYHVHLWIQPMLGPDVPALQKAWLKVTCPRCDYNIIKTSGVIRMPGTYHTKKPGQYKKLISSHDGALFTVPDLRGQLPPPKFTVGVSDDDPEELNQILDNLLYKTVTEGTRGRNLHAYKIACCCRDLGMDYEEAVDLIDTWSVSNCIPPLRPAEIPSTARSAYKRKIRA